MLTLLPPFSEEPPPVTPWDTWTRSRLCSATSRSCGAPSCVGVNMLFSTVNSSGSSSNLLIVSYLARLLFFSARRLSNSCFTTGEARIALRSPVIPFSLAKDSSHSKLGTIRAVRYFRRSPMTATCSTASSIFRKFSMFCGATFLPPAVMIRSFFRSVILTNPSASTSPMSPVANQPSGSSTSRVAASLFQYPFMICGPRARISPSGAIRTSVSAQGLPTVPSLKSSGRFPVRPGDVSVRP